MNSIEQALEQISKIPKSGAFVGVDRVQTVGLAVESNKRRTLLEKLAEQGGVQGNADRRHEHEKPHRAL